MSAPAIAIAASSADHDPRAADRNSRNASLTLAFAQPGDTLLYLLLPLHHETFGVSLAEAGLLLAANRLVRIAGYGWIARLYAERGARASCLLAALAALLATIGYASLSGLWVLLVARLLWGLAFAAMNVATQALATAEPTGAARRSGTMRVDHRRRTGQRACRGRDRRAVRRAARRVSAACRGGAAGVPVRGKAAARRRGSARTAAAAALRLPSRLDTWSFVQGMTFDGLFVLGISVLAAAALPGYAALAAGAALALRYVAEILLGAARRRARRTLWRAAGADAAVSRDGAGTRVIGAGALWVGAVLVVVLRGLIQPIPAPVVALENPGRDRVPALARLATWRDLGAGAGPLLAGALLPLVAQEVLYGVAAALLAASAVAISVLGPASARI